jgi:hypothetical protein
MATKDSLLTYQDGNLAKIAAIYGDRLQSLCLVEKFAILTDIGAWGDQCCGLEETDWSSFGEFMTEHGETSEDYDAHGLLTHPDCDWIDPKFAMPLVAAIAHQIAEGIYLPEDAE